MSVFPEMGWSMGLLLVAAVFGFVFCLALALFDTEFRNWKRNRKRIRISNLEIDPASITGQFHVPYAMKDKK